ncbi:hypothetical protein ACE3MS_03440 [Paenibacillus dendritiformis]|uniref:hypothetical protein n=1 Tax=Paenibacillus dendritiformis TaxID=130049 RepID=UPI00364B2AA1
MVCVQEWQKLIKLTGTLAKAEAVTNGTYIVYKTGTGQIVREYPNGEIVPINELRFPQEGSPSISEADFCRE